MIKTKYWCMAIAAVLVLSVCLVMLGERNGDANNDGAIAEIYSNGRLVRTVELGDTSQVYVLYVETDGGSNTVTVENGTLRVTAASCPDGVCIKQGRLTRAAPIVCLPNRLVIQMKESPKADDTKTYTDQATTSVDGVSG